MIDPATLGASVILKLALDKFVEAGAGEAAKATVAGAVELVKGLRNRISAQFAGNDRATAALAAAEQGDPAALAEATTYLEQEMLKNRAFDQEIKQMAQQIINIQNQSSTTLNQQNLNYGRDQNIINQPQGDIRIGGS